MLRMPTSIVSWYFNGREDCRDNAIRCVAMANSAKERRTQSLLVYLAEAWTKLAEELESNEAFRIAAKRVDIFKPQ